jgi:hypothetical protein
MASPPTLGLGAAIICNLQVASGMAFAGSGRFGGAAQTASELPSAIATPIILVRATVIFVIAKAFLVIESLDQ